MKIDQVLALAKKNVKQGNLQSAKEIYSAVLNKFPSSKVAKKALNEIEQKSKKLHKPTITQTEQNYLIQLYSNAKYGEAISEAKRLLKANSENIFLLNILGASFKALGQQNEAIFCFKKILDINPNYADAHNNLGSTFKDIGRYDDAILSYQKALNINPNFAQAHNNLGKILKITAQFDKAVICYENALKSQNNFLDPLSDEISLLVQLCKLKKIYNDKKLQELQTLAKNQNNLVAKTTLGINAFINSLFDESKLMLDDIKTQIENGLLLKLNSEHRKFVLAYYNFLNKLIPINIEQTNQKNFNTHFETIYHIGDSHCLSFAHQKFKLEDTNYAIAPIIIFGAKAWHFCTNKTNEFKAIFEYHIKNLNPKTKLLISFGEIDCRSDEGIIEHSLKTKKALSTTISQTINGYIDYMQKHLSNSDVEVYYVGVPAPIILPSQTEDERAATRVKVIKEFNECLKSTLKQRKLKFIDVYKLSAKDDSTSNLKHMCDDFHLSPLSLAYLKDEFKD